MIHKQLDTRGLLCPLPILKTTKAVKGLEAGETLEILATDPGSVPDFEAFCQRAGHALLEQSEEKGIFRFVIRKAV